LRKERTFRFEDIAITVWPGVFHPGLFSSSLFLLSFLKEQNLRDKQFIELGCGSGLIAIYAARQGAVVTATDINQRALSNASQNAVSNQAHIDFIHSDLFMAINGTFEWIVINPPYYPKKPTNDADFAWYCGEHFEYFENLFLQLPMHIHENTEIIMVLTKGCDLNAIFNMARRRGFEFQLLKEKNVLLDEKDYIFKISPTSIDGVQA
jgi:release factor glutamine methyltransferase